MAAQPDLDLRGEPAQLPVGFAGAVRHHERRLGEQVLGADRLQRLVREPFVERHDRGLVAAEQAVGEGIDVPVGHRESAHGLVSSLANSSVSTSLLPGSSTWPSGSMWIRSSIPGNTRHKSSSTRSITAWAWATVMLAGRSTWNWTKSRFPLVRVRKSCSLLSSG